MTDTSEHKLPIWFWIIAALALLWNLFGVYQAYLTSTATIETLQPYLDDKIMAPEYAGFILAYPTWAKGVFWLGTVSGTLGALCLLLRKSIAVPLFALSVISIFVMYGYNYIVSGKANVLTGFNHFITAAVILIAIFMLWFARKKKAKNWLT